MRTDLEFSFPLGVSSVDLKTSQHESSYEIEKYV